MFTTLRNVADSTLVTEHESNVFTRIACQACRSGKLKCVREKGGCRRCRVKDIPCRFSDSSRSRRWRTRNVSSKDSSSTTVTHQAQVPIEHNASSSASGQSVQLLGPSPADSSSAAPLSWINSTSYRGSETLDLEGIFDSRLTHWNDFFSGSALTDGENYFQLHHPDWIAEPLDAETTLTATSTDHRPYSHADVLPASVSGSLTFNELECATTIRAYDYTEAIGAVPDNDSPTGVTIDIENPEFPGDVEILRSPQQGRTTTGVDMGALGPQLCNCLSVALDILDTITVNESNSTIPMIPQLIRLNKRVLMQSRPLLDCTRCSGIPTITMLLTVLCQKLISSYENIVDLLVQLYGQVHEAPNSEAQVPVAGFEEPDRVRVSTYQVELREEPCVFVGVITLQLGIFRTFLVNLKTVQSSKSNAHVMLVDSIDARVLKLGHFINRRCEL
ncbi:hypothetical protein F5884DRAFT_798408 [Xylogone sp. PMI_703]|nr:hypothetical protein F5884DRAFT_798408 [Xylogone sp. PMI_703]